MANLTEPLEKAVSGEHSVGLLVADYNVERKALDDAIDAQARDAAGNWMAAGEILAGETQEAKLADFRERMDAAQKAAEFIQNAQNQAARTLPELYAPSGAPGEKRFAPPGGDGQPQPGAPLASQLHYKAMEATPEFQALSALMGQGKAQMLAGWKSAPPISTKASDLIPSLKVSSYIAPGANPAGLMPTDNIGMPYNLSTAALALFPMYSEAGSNVRYMQSRTPAVDPDADTRTRGGTIADMDDDGRVIQDVKQSIGVMASVAIEDLMDNGRISMRIEEQLNIEMRKRMEGQLLAGDNTGTNWRGILPQLTANATNISALGIAHNTVPVAAGGQEQEPVAFIEEVAAELAERGTPATVLIVGRSAWSTIRKSQRVQRYQEPDVTRMPWGSVAGVPMVLSRYLGANTALLIDTQDGVVDIVLGSEVMTFTSEDFGFDKGLMFFRRLVYGNVALVKPYGAVKITATNLFVAAT